MLIEFAANSGVDLVQQVTVSSRDVKKNKNNPTSSPVCVPDSCVKMIPGHQAVCGG